MKVTWRRIRRTRGIDDDWSIGKREEGISQAKPRRSKPDNILFSFNRDCPVFLLPVLVSSPFLLRLNFYCSTIISDFLALPHQESLSSPLRHLRPEFQTSAPPPSLNLIHSSRSISRLYFVRPHVLEHDEFGKEEEEEIPAVDHPFPPRFPFPSPLTSTLPRLFIISSIQKALNASSKDSD